MNARLDSKGSLKQRGQRLSMRMTDPRTRVIEAHDARSLCS
jgi:hypothetical protein